MLRLGSNAIVFACMLGCVQSSSTEAKPDQDQTRTKPKDEQVEAIVRSVVAERLRLKPQSLDMKAPLSDELDVLDIVMTLEERFMVEIPDRIIEKHSGAKLGEPTCKLSPSQLVAIVEESREH